MTELEREWQAQATIILPQPQIITRTIIQTTNTQHIHNKTHHPPKRNKPYDIQ